MNWLLFVAGAVLIAVVMADVVITALAVGTSAGPLTGRVTHRLWQLGLKVGGGRLLQALGVALTLLVLAVWLTLLWLGWTLVFSADPAAVVVTSSGEPVGFWDRVYFVGYTLFTLGNGDLRPDGALWKVLSIVALLNGLGLATLGITYLVPVTAAASERRRLAATIAGLGQRADDMLIRAWNGTDFGFLPQNLARLAPEIDLLAQRHLTYPVLHFFHSSDVDAAAAVAIARIDEAVTLLRAGVAGNLVDPAAIDPLHNALTRFLDTLRAAFIKPSDDAPAVPPLARLRAAGVPTVDQETFVDRLHERAQRRRALVGFIRNDGWAWSEVWSARDGDETDRESPKT